MKDKVKPGTTHICLHPDAEKILSEGQKTGRAPATLIAVMALGRLSGATPTQVRKGTLKAIRNLKSNRS